MRMRTIIRWHKKRRENLEKNAQLRADKADSVSTPSENVADNDLSANQPEQPVLASAA